MEEVFIGGVLTIDNQYHQGIVSFHWVSGTNVIGYCGNQTSQKLVETGWCSKRSNWNEKRDPIDKSFFKSDEL